MVSSAKTVAVGVILAWGIASLASAEIFETTTTGSPNVKSIHVLSFAPEGVLLIGDGTGSQIFAVRTGDVSPRGTLEGKIEGIDAKMAGRLGTTSDGIEIIDFAVRNEDLACQTFRFLFEVVEPLVQQFWGGSIMDYAGEWDDVTVSEDYLEQQLDRCNIGITPPIRGVLDRIYGE